MVCWSLAVWQDWQPADLASAWSWRWKRGAKSAMT